MVWYVVGGLCFGVVLVVVLDVVLRRVDGIVSWPHRLWSIVIRGGEEWLLIVGLMVLSISVGHPAFG